MHTLNSKSINGLVAFIVENITMSGKDGRILVKPGLKMTHVGNKKVQGSGLNYTVDSVIPGDDGLLVKCIRHGSSPDNDVVLFLTIDEIQQQFERT
mgnify:CR=1 FL=1|tara:strand:- start:676 stop:963 length:288 start_codon:yes stop_codon:yes gene_type:complete